MAKARASPQPVLVFNPQNWNPDRMQLLSSARKASITGASDRYPLIDVVPFALAHAACLAAIWTGSPQPT